MEQNKSGRYPKDHPRAGGFIVLWAQQTLNSEKLRNPLIAGCLFKVACVAQLIDYETGRFERAGIALDALSIAKRASITVEQFNNLLIMGLVAKEVVNSEVVFFLTSWNEHQNPKYTKSALNVPEKCQAPTPTPFTKEHSPYTNKQFTGSATNSKYDSTSKKDTELNQNESEVNLDW
jgi:hypothetical protein